MGEPNGMGAKSLDYVLGIEDCAMMVYDHLNDTDDMRRLKKAMESLLDSAKAIRNQRFIEENGLLD